MVEPDVFTAPWYPWYVNDVLTSERVELMSLTEEGAYRRALDRAWKKGSVPADPVQCARAIGKRCTPKVAEIVLQMFQPMRDDPTRMVNDTLEKVREEQRQKYLKRSAKGKAAADQRWHGDATGIPQAMPEQCHSESDTDFHKKDKEVLPQNPKPPKPEPKTLLPEDYRPTPAMIEWAGYDCPLVPVETELVEFRTFWIDIATKNNKRTLRGWHATWKKRMRDVQERLSLNSNGRGPKPPARPDVPANDDAVWTKASEPDPPCPYCGKEICWADHRADMHIQ